MTNLRYIEALGQPLSAVAVGRNFREKINLGNTFENLHALGNSFFSVNVVRWIIFESTAVTSRPIWMVVGGASEEDPPTKDVRQLRKGQILEELSHMSNCKLVGVFIVCVYYRDQR